MQPFFIELVTSTDESRRAFEMNPHVLRIVADGLDVDRYRQLLSELYHVVWHFNPICAAAASRLSDEYRAVRYYLYDHVKEEKGHEEWVMADLEVVGVARQLALSHQPSTSLLSLLGYNYWSADRRHPCSVLGMIYALEVIASVYGGPITVAIQQSLLLDGTHGITFISSHVEMDSEHMAELRVVANTLHDESAKTAIIESTMINFALFTNILEGI